MLDTSTPSLARACDYLLGGGASFAADRSLAARLLPLYPRLRDVLLSSRTQVADALAHIARQGVDQYLDIGSGLPTTPCTHEAARHLRPRARVIYVDRDPAVVDHGRALVPPGVRYMAGDLAEPEALLAELGHRPGPPCAAPVTPAAPAAPAVVDFSRPVCVVLGLVLPVLDPSTARGVVRVLVKALAPGSYLVATVGAGKDGQLPDAIWPVSPPAGEFAGFFAGLDLLPPGIRAGHALCGAGVKPLSPLSPLSPTAAASGTPGARDGGADPDPWKR